MKTRTCGDCGVEEGQLHEFGCDMERCPFCGNQLISCNCVYELLKIRDEEKYTAETSFLPPDIYSEGITVAQERQWLKLLNDKGRIPWIDYPIICARCGKLWPRFFMVTDEAWKHYIQPNQRRSVLCEACYDEIKNLIDQNTGGNSVYSTKIHI